MNPNWHYALCIMNYELIMTYDFLQHYWWFIVSLLGALLVFMMFVQGANSVLFSLSGKNEDELRLITNSTGKKWEITFTTLVTFGGAFFASFPLFYSTSFGGAYWVWMLILVTFVLQAVSQSARRTHLPMVPRHQRHCRPVAARHGSSDILQRL